MSAFLDEILAYVALGADDRTRLAGLHGVLAPDFPAIAEEFYAAVQASPGAATVLRSGSADGLHATLIDWMSSGLLGPYDDAFRTKRSKIGRRHVEIGLAQHFMITAMNVVRRAYDARIAAAYSPVEARLVSCSVDKLLDVELAVMLHDYQLDSQGRQVASERARQGERVEALQTLCAGLAHELRNPLNSARLQLELLQRRLRRGGDDPKLLDPVELVRHEIERLTTLLDEFLAFARPPALDAHRHDVVAVVRDVISRELPAAVRRGAALALVGAPAPVVAEIDAGKLDQIVDNLVTNAIEAVSAGGHVTVAVESADGRVHIRVSDDGPGIPTHVLPRIYEPFFSTKEGGTGMGMSIVHSLVALHHGTIDVASSPRGTTFDVAIPRRNRP